MYGSSGLLEKILRPFIIIVGRFGFFPLQKINFINSINLACFMSEVQSKLVVGNKEILS